VTLAQTRLARTRVDGVWFRWLRAPNVSFGFMWRGGGSWSWYSKINPRWSTSTQALTPMLSTCGRRIRTRVHDGRFAVPARTTVILVRSAERGCAWFRAPVGITDSVSLQFERVVALRSGSVVLRPGVALISDLMPTTQIAVEKATTSQDNASIVSIMVVSLLLLYMKILYPEAVHPRGPAEKRGTLVWLTNAIIIIRIVRVRF